MCELMTEEKIEKIKASSAEIIVEKIDGKPYYSIKYFDLSKNQGYIGFGSYNLDIVFGYMDKYFDVVEEDNIRDNKMSDDLISRKALMVAINTDFYEHFTACHDSDQTALIDMVMQDIEEIPSAYDVDAVCKEMNKIIGLSENCPYIQKDCFKKNCEDCMVEKCIEIVRNGGKKL